MKTLLIRSRGESGQVIVFLAVILTALVGMAALVVDVGSWYQADRRLQTAADAAALAGVQELPLKQSDAQRVAEQYAQTNYPGMPIPKVTFPDSYTIDVVAQADTRGIFAPVLNEAFDVVTVHAAAQARILTPNLKNVAPIAIKETAACIVSDKDCFGPTHTVTLGFDESNIASSLIGLINLECQSESRSGCGSGSTGGSQLQDWIEDGYPHALPVNMWYGVKTGQTVGPVEHGLNDAANRGATLFFPVFDEADAANRSFHIIAWAAFVIHPNGVNWGSQTKELTGHFVTLTRENLQYDGGTPGGIDFGVPLVITLTK